MKRFFLTFFFILFCFLFSQKNISIDDVTHNQDFINRNNNFKHLKWQKDTYYYTFVKDNNLIQQNAEILNNNEIFSFSQINNLYKANNIDSLLEFPNYEWVNNTQFVIRHKKCFLFLDINNKNFFKKIELPDKAEIIIPSNDFKFFAFTFENNLYVKEDSVQIVTIEENNNENIVAGQIFNTNLFKNTGVFWSPDNSKIAYFLINDSTSTFKYLNNINNLYPQKIKYYSGNNKIPKISLKIFNLKQRTKTIIDNDYLDFYTSNVVWSSDSKYLAVRTISKDYKKSALKLFDASNGKFIKTLYNETSEFSVSSNSDNCFLKNKDKLIIQANNSGYKQLYLIDFEGNSTFITQGNFDVESIVGVSDDNHYVYFKSNKENPIEHGLFKSEIKENAEIINLTKISGTHNVLINRDFNYFIDEYSNIRIFKAVNINSTKNGEIVRSINSQVSPLKSYNQCDVSIFKIKSSDNINELYCRIIRPCNFTSEKKYPIVFVFNKSIKNQSIKNTFLAGASLFEYYLAQNQYIIVSIDTRGTENRGLLFENAVYDKLGIVESQDVYSLLNYLKKLQYVDTNKIGALASNYGAYIALNMSFLEKKIFKAVAIISPITDFNLYDNFFTHKYIKIKNDSLSIIKKAGMLKSKLLMIHGALDRDVLIENSTKLFEEFIKFDKNVDFIIYPSYDNRIEYKKNVMCKILDFFDEKLK